MILTPNLQKRFLFGLIYFKQVKIACKKALKNVKIYHNVVLDIGGLPPPEFTGYV